MASGSSKELAEKRCNSDGESVERSTATTRLTSIQAFLHLVLYQLNDRRYLEVSDQLDIYLRASGEMSAR